MGRRASAARHSAGQDSSRGSLCFSVETQMKIFIGQINPTVGALSANAELIRNAYEQGVRAGADLVMVTELAVTGYPPRDLLDPEIFVHPALESRGQLAKITGKKHPLFRGISP